MALREDFEQSGNWLFRWRSYLPIVGLGLILLSFRDFEYFGHSETRHHLWELFCLAISFLGLAIRAYTIGHTPRGTSGRNTKEPVADALNTTGAYSLVRNPLYLGNFFMWIGIVLFAHSWCLTLVFTLVFWLYYERIIFAEESYLRSKFGEDFLQWSDATPAFIPRFERYEKPQLPFSFKNVLRREYNGFSAVIVVMFLLDTLSAFFVEGRIEFDWGWLVALGIGLAVWLTFRTLNGKTTLLNVDGR